MRDIVVVLPGIMGSVLRKDGRDLWALSGSSVLDAIRTLGRNIDRLTLKDDPPDADDLGDGVTADALFPTVHLLPGFWKIDGYTQLVQRIEREFQVERGKNFFEFPYDWRRDNRVAARRLKRQSADWLRTRREGGYGDAKLVLLAHSMGGLVARYFLECLDGWRDTRLLVSFGTPYAGSLKALGFLANGFEKKLGGLVLADLTALLRSFTSVHQLLPTYKCYDPGDGMLRRLDQVQAVPGLVPERVAKAFAFHDEIERAVDANRGDEAYGRAGYTTRPIVGTYQPTFQSAKREGAGVTLSSAYPGREDLDGDGTVPRASATPRELLGRSMEMFVAEAHGSLQNADPVLVQVAGLRAGGPELERATPAPGISLALDDAYAAGEPIRIRSRCEAEDVTLAATVVDVRSGREVARIVLRPGADDVQEGECAPLSEGTYRVTVRLGTVASVSDVFIVSGP